MKHQNIFWGSVLVVAGIFLLFDRMNIYSLDWWAVSRLWPFLLIIWGVGILPVKSGIKLLLTLLVVVASTLTYVSYAGKSVKSPVKWRIERSYDDVDSGYSEQIFTEPYNDTINSVKLRMDAGAGSFSMGGTTGELIYASSKGNLSRFDFRVEEKEQEAKIVISQNTATRRHRNRGVDFNLMLNQNPVWDFDFNIGAAEFNFDFSPYKVNSIDIDGGAASINLRLGKLYPETKVTINAGASAIRIKVPEDAGCRIEGTTVLSSRKLDGFDKISKGVYETPDFESAGQKITVKVDAAVSSFTVDRY